MPFVSELPRISSDDEGKILRVNADGAWEAQELATISVENATIDGLMTTTYEVPEGFTSGFSVSLTDDIETALGGI